MTAFSFDLLAVDARTGARAGVLHTPHGAVPTPVYMPVGTQATVKTLTPDELVAAGAAIILANTYHLSLRPGAERVARFGGLHGFMGWDGPIHRFTPERVIELQEALGADIIMPLDECLPYGVDQPAAEEALERTQRWAERSVAAQTRRDQALFGIVQGGMHARLRWRAATERSAQRCVRS